MAKLTAESLLAQMQTLQGLTVPYATGKSLCTLVSVEAGGGIKFRRHAVALGDHWTEPLQNISANMIRKSAVALATGTPVQMDRLFRAGGNARSALEALLAACPSIFLSRPVRLTETGEQVKGRSNKHLVWLPDRTPHKPGAHEWLPDDEAGYITEVPSQEVFSNVAVGLAGRSLEVAEDAASRTSMETEELRQHSEKQVFLCAIAHWMGMRPWVAINDHGIVTQGKSIMSMPGVVQSLEQEPAFAAWQDAVAVAQLVDCIWFMKGAMPVAFEVEHTTGITSGLTRMQTLKDRMLGLATEFVVVAPDGDRSKFAAKAGEVQFVDLKPWFLPYSSLSELYVLSRRRRFPFQMLPEKMRFLQMFLEKPSTSVAEEETFEQDSADGIAP